MSSCGILLMALTAVNIDCGRQLFVDDWLVGETNGVVRHWNTPAKVGDAPILSPTSEREGRSSGGVFATDGGLWWDPKLGKYRLWYETGWCGELRYAESEDGLNWTLPDLGIVKGTNRLFEKNPVDTWSVSPDYKAADPYASWCMFVSEGGGMTPDKLFRATDGVHFEPLGTGGISGDRSSAYFDPFRGKWIFSLRDYWRGRSRRIYAKDAFDANGPKWHCVPPEKEKSAWVVPEKWTELPNGPLYSFTATPYESLMLGVMETHVAPKRGPNGEGDNAACDIAGLPKHTHLQFSFSRDGRTYRQGGAACSIQPSEWGSGKWDTGYLSTVGGVCVIRDERLWFYYTGLRGDAERRKGNGFVFAQGSDPKCIGTYYNGAIGAATLRRDGFAGLVADGRGSLTTKEVVFTGRHLFVNAECRFGELAAEIVDAGGAAIPGFAAADCRGLKFADTTKRELVFAGGDLSALAGKPVRIRFNLHCATLYSFWVSPSAKGESRGYVAAGGPAYPGLRDL